MHNSRKSFENLSSFFDHRKFYERKLMKNAFCILEDAWWRTRKGWKLNIRAEYHNRYVEYYVVKWLSMRTHNTGVVSSNPACVTMKSLLARKAMGNHLRKSTP